MREIAGLDVRRIGRVAESGEVPWQWRLIEPTGCPVESVDEFLRDMLACDRSVGSLRSYAYGLLLWFRFLWAVGVAWERAERADARDFALWLLAERKPLRVRRLGAPVPGSVNALTGKPYPGLGYAPRTRRHARAVARSFYEFHREIHGRPLINPFPAASGEAADVNRHHNPMQQFVRPWRQAPYQPREPKRLHRAISEQGFADLFGALSCDRDRALVAFYVSTAARAQELLGVTLDRVNAEDQLIGVFRKGTRVLQWLPAAVDAFVWLRLHHQSMYRRVALRPGDPVWWTLRKPLRPLKYDAVRMVFNRANAILGGNWTLHDLRHTALQRMARDPHMSLFDVQWVAGHAHISSTEPYLEPSQDDVVAAVLAHQARVSNAGPPRRVAAPGYRAEVLETLLGPAAGRFAS